MLRLEGSWNLESAKSFFKAYKTLLSENELRRFGVMTDFRGLEGATPDCIEFFNQIAEWAKPQGQVARAQLIDTDLMAYIADMGTPNKELFPIQSFKTEAQALAWLASQGLNTA